MLTSITALLSSIALALSPYTPATLLHAETPNHEFITVDAQGKKIPTPNTHAHPLSHTNVYIPRTMNRKDTKVVIPPDERTRIDSTTTFPNSAIVYISSYGYQHCSGSMVGPDTILTAGHCVWDYSDESWYEDLEFSPGAHDKRRPFGTATAKAIYISKNWVTNGARDADWALIKINKKLGYKTGWFAINASTDSYLDTKVTVRGYSSETIRPAMWTMDGTITDETIERIYYNIDTFSGQSGSPVYTTTYATIGIHTLGHYRNQAPSRNSAVRITPLICGQIDQLRQQ